MKTQEDQRTLQCQVFMMPLYLTLAADSCIMIWSNQITDFCDNAIVRRLLPSIHNMDRYLARQPGVLYDKRQFQLIAMTCFYMAAKVNEQEAIDPSTVSKLSKGIYSAAEVEEAEKNYLCSSIKSQYLQQQYPSQRVPQTFADLPCPSLEKVSKCKLNTVRYYTCFFRELTIHGLDWRQFPMHCRFQAMASAIVHQSMRSTNH
jgi:hypothetical protein